MITIEYLKSLIKKCRDCEAETFHERCLPCELRNQVKLAQLEERLK